MPFRPCPSGCGCFLSADDGHDRCLQCLGFQHAEDAFVDDSCACCGRMSMISLRSRLYFMKGLAPSAATRAGLSGSSRGPPADALGGGREVGVRILNYLDDWLILAQSREQLSDHRDLVLQHLSQLVLRVNWEKSKLSPVQRISFLGVELDSVSMTARLTEERAQAVLNWLSSFRGRNVVPLKQFQRLLGHMVSAAAVTPHGLLHMRPLQHWLHSRVPRWAWRRGTLRVGISQQCRHSLSPWTDPAFLRAGVPLE